MKTILGLFDVILTGEKDESCKASREVRKLLYASGSNDKYEDIAPIIQNVPAEYAKIKEEFRQENFAMATSVIYFLRHKENNPDFLFSWFFGLLRHDT